MELAAIHQARVMAFVEPIDLNPTAQVFFPDLVKALVARYDFQRFPQKFEDLDEKKGITFAAGHLGGSVIEELIIYAYGLTLDTRTSTDESKRLLVEAMHWGSKELGLAYKPVKRWQYASQITFHSTIPLTPINSAFQRLAQGTANRIKEILGEDLTYELTTITIDYDQLARKHALGRFSIQRRDNTPFSENKYFSDAPLPTDLHMALLQQFEADLSHNNPSR